MGAKLVAALPVAHPIDDATAIELRAPFAEPEKRRAAGQELKDAGVVERQFLHRLARRIGHAYGQGRAGHGHAKVSDGMWASADGSAALIKRRQRAIAIQLRYRATRHDRQAQRHRRQRADPDLDGRATDRERLPLRPGIDAQHRSGARDTDPFQRAATVHGRTGSYFAPKVNTVRVS